ncbi:hypothetical protein GII36_04670 [Candidatus Mycosynbacter amalyticus]|uniref:Uncharacterized protein n=1 Tax=Candidatus Mycosynbacter amalyticus TaxID=2665156 RepID=A0A857MUP3_9BACT|nr:hypothetical protein [Candidatus Mycosynbacter amalyticus]QHN43117.1 hypothetical protein GII36_04670 [Candidatus Mycosynbacter amalyticus]
MADNITQRRMSAEEEANLHKQIQDFSHTIQPSSASELVTQAANPLAQIDSGQSLHEQLLRRAEQREHLDATLGDDSRFYDYKTSLVGSAAQDQEVRRQMALVQQKDRQAREKRFAHRGLSRRNARHVDTNRRQNFNTATTPGTKESSDNKSTRQGFNGQPPEQARTNVSFREPQTRSYDPFK